MIRDTNAIETTGEVIEDYESNEPETSIVEYQDDDEGMAWFDDLDQTVFNGAEEREAKRRELLRRGSAFKLIEHDVGETLGAFWGFITR